MMKKRAWWIVCFAFVMAFVAGCQSIAGVNMSKVLYNPDLKSYEGKTSISLALDYVPQTPRDEEHAEEQAMMQLFKNAKIVLSSVRVEDVDKMSMEGTIEVSKGSVPFQVSMNQEQLVVKLEGAGEPIVFRTLGMGGISKDTSGLNEEASKKLMQTYDSILDALMSYVVKQLPNPNTIDVQDASIEINSELLNLKHVTAEMKASEAADYVLKFLANIIADKDGLNALIDQLFELIAPIYTLQMEDDTSSAEQMLADMKAEKTQIVDSILEMVTSAHDELDKNLKEDPEFATSATELDPNSSLKVDLYVDDQFNTRKAKYELFLAPKANIAVNEELKSIRVIIEEEKWNLNGTVVANQLAIGPNAIIVDEEMRPRKMMRSMNAASLAYDILRNDLHMTRQTAAFAILPADFIPEPGQPQPYIVNGTSMVPLRTAADNFDAKVQWNSKTKQVELFDEGKKIVMPHDSKSVYLDGNKKFLGMKVVNKNGVTYVPARATFKLIDAQVKWKPQTKEVVIQRQ
jgi:hypothetical protein